MSHNSSSAHPSHSKSLFLGDTPLASCGINTHKNVNRESKTKEQARRGYKEEGFFVLKPLKLITSSLRGKNTKKQTKLNTSNVRYEGYKKNLMFAERINASALSCILLQGTPISLAETRFQRRRTGCATLSKTFLEPYFYHLWEAETAKQFLQQVTYCSEHLICTTFCTGRHKPLCQGRGFMS